MSTSERVLYTDSNFVKFFIAACTPQNWCYGYTIFVYAHYPIRQKCISVLFNLHKLFYKNLFNSSEDVLQCHKSPTDVVLRLI